MFDQIKTLIAYTLSLDIILAATAAWLSSFGTLTSEVGSFLVGFAGMVISALTAVKLWESIKTQRLTNKKLELETKALESKSSKIIK